MSNINNESFEIRIDGKAHKVGTAEITGRQVLDIVGKTPDKFLLTLVIAEGPDRLVDPDETIDLSAPGTEEFNLVTKERFFSLRIDEQAFSVPTPILTGGALLAMVGKTPEKFLLTFQIVGQADTIIDATEKVDLSQPGREQFWTVERKPLSISIDGINYTASKAVMSGTELRALPKPPITENRDLWLDIPGKDDLRIKSEDNVTLKDGMAFYTAPSKINPGSMSHDPS